MYASTRTIAHPVVVLALTFGIDFANDMLASTLTQGEDWAFSLYFLASLSDEEKVCTSFSFNAQGIGIGIDIGLGTGIG